MDKCIYDIDEIMQPVWNDGGVSRWESIFPALNADGKAEASLYFEDVEEILALTSADAKTVYIEGQDYTFAGGRLSLNKSDRLKLYTHEELCFDEKTEQCFGAAKGLPYKYILFGEGHFFHDKQLSVTYRHGGKWHGPVPASQRDRLPNTERLLNEGAIKVLIYGDSIAAGGNASGCIGVSPYIPRFGELFCDYLAHSTGAAVDVVNTAVGGTATEWGLKNADELAASHKPDLAILAFGMNDGSGFRSAKDFAANISGIIASVRAKNPKAEFLLVSSILPNKQSCLFGLQEEYPAALASLAGEGIAFANVQPFHAELLRRKNYIDLTGNNVNHPNDFLHRVYAQVLAATVGVY